MPEQVLSAAGYPLVVSTENNSDRFRVTLRIKSPSDCILHWGVSGRPGGEWHCPPRRFWPEGTVMVDGRAARTPFTPSGKDERVLSIDLEPPGSLKNLAFVLFMPKENRWLKNGRDDFIIPLPRLPNGGLRPEEAVARWLPEATASWTFNLDDGTQLAAAVRAEANSLRVILACDADAPVLLHWGLAEHFRHEWKLPPENQRPVGTSVFEEKAARTAFPERDGLRCLELEFHKPADGPGPRGLRFVLFQRDTGEWLKQGGSEMMLPLFAAEADRRLPSGKLREVAEAIIEAEVGTSSWSLMHRFNLCHDLLGKAEDDPESLALLFPWLRYSAIRQLDWQRSYNTKPRELSHAEERLTQRLAAVWRRHAGGSPGRWWARAMLATLGRGGEGQRVRDEILHIMHRNQLKESGGSFMEEWHQKLHNNTTPDDVVIAEAYLAFLRSGGDRKLFYQTLEQGGVSRARLQSFERPIRTDPVFHANRKDALIGEFENFLRILKSLHSGTDLETAAAFARGRLDAHGQSQIDRVLSKRKGDPIDLLRAIGSARAELTRTLDRSPDDAARRDLLFVDLALDESFRGAVERQDIESLALDGLLQVAQMATQNVKQSLADDELVRINRHWDTLLAKRSIPDWALQALSAVERLNRWVQASTTAIHNQLQPKAEYLGEAFGVEKWVMPLFSEETIRGGPVFALSRVLRRLEPELRKAAGLGGWQIVSPAQTFGRVRVVDNLLAVQAERYTEATVLVTDFVSGEEEIAEGVKAVLTTSQVDLVSHVAVRARNAGVLLAICFDPTEWEQLKKHANQTLALSVTPAGDIKYQEADAPLHTVPTDGGSRRVAPVTAPARYSSKWAVAADAFTREIVGGKSNNLNGLRNQLPDWIHLPISVAMPFGVLERVLRTEFNRPIREEVETLLPQAESDPDRVLRRVRSALTDLTAPAELKTSLLDVWQRAGLPVVSWDQVWRSITRVWASKWNERAYLSRRARGILHDHLLIAVLIQQVVEADYAFVIHTANPINRSRDEIFAEVVLGLGETLVGNSPGRALGFVCRKSDLSLQVVSYPSKSVGLYGKGVIFRSDSNGEDLQGFAGAGLYDSFLAEKPERRLLDYSTEPLVWDLNFRTNLLRSIARIGLEVEKVLGSPQDIEGAVSGGRFFVVQTRPQVGLD